MTDSPSARITHRPGWWEGKRDRSARDPLPQLFLSVSPFFILLTNSFRGPGSTFWIQIDQVQTSEISIHFHFEFLPMEVPWLWSWPGPLSKVNYYVSNNKLSNKLIAHPDWSLLVP